MGGHRLRLKISGSMRGPDFEPVWDIVCDEDMGDPDRPCKLYDVEDWPDAYTCRCTDVTCECRIADHGMCTTFPGEVDEIGHVCRAKVLPECYFAHWVHETSFEDCVAVEGDLVCQTWPVTIEHGGDHGAFIITPPEDTNA